MTSLISIIIPCYRSESYLERTVGEILEQFPESAPERCQIILVDDASPDGTFEVIRSLCAAHPQLMGLRLSTNFGQSRARMAALPYVKGDCAVFMDDDGQHPAAGIRALVQKLNEDYDMVYARFPSPKESLFRRTASALADRCMSAVTKKPKGLKITSFFAISDLALRALSQYKSPYIFLGGYLFEITSRITSVEIAHRARMEGASRYTLRKLYSMWMDNMLAFPQAPAGALRVLGALTAAAAVILFAAAAIGTSGLLAVSGFLCLLFGILFEALGVLGEVLVRTYILAQGVPASLVREITGHDTP